MDAVMGLTGGVGGWLLSTIPKQFIEVLRKPILIYTLEIFRKNKNKVRFTRSANNDMKRTERVWSTVVAIRKFP